METGGLLTSFILHFSTFFALMNPFGNTALFMSFTEGDDMKTKKLLARESLVAAFIVILVFSIGGKYIFGFFGISVTAFRITGGILLASIGFNMLHGQKSAINTPKNLDKEEALQAKLSVAVTPLGIPIFAGPGAITTALNSVATEGLTGMVITLSSFAFLCVLTYIFFLNGQKVLFFLGRNGIAVLTRLMGLMLSVMGVEMFIAGLRTLVETLK